MKKKFFLALILFLLSFFVFSVIERERNGQVNKKIVQPVIEEKVLPSEKEINLAKASTSELGSDILKKEEKINTEDSKTEERVEAPAKIKKIKTGKTLIANVPFLAQAPYGDWRDPRQQNGCEEASSLIAMSWVEGKKEVSRDEALKSILAMAKFELDKYGSFRDTSASSTIDRILVHYFAYHQARLQYDIGADDIITELEKGNLVMAPFDGQKLGNIYFTAPGPDRHMLVIIGYDYDKKEFITNDPGTRHGEAYRYGRNVLVGAIRDYPTGEDLPIIKERKVMIVISR